MSACAGFETPVKPEDKVVKLAAPPPAPKGPNHDYEIGDAVSIIENNGVFTAKGRISAIGADLVFAEDFVSSSKKIWKLAVPSQSKPSDKNFAPKGYKVDINERHRIFDEWFPPPQIFPAPWANNVNLKVGDTVYIRRFGSDPYRAVIEKLPAGEFGSFFVKRGDHQTTELAPISDVFSSIEPAQSERLSPGDIVYYDRMHWTIIVGKRDNKIVIRPEGFPATDMMVDISKLQILK